MTILKTHVKQLLEHSTITALLKPEPGDSSVNMTQTSSDNTNKRLGLDLDFFGKRLGAYFKFDLELGLGRRTVQSRIQLDLVETFLFVFNNPKSAPLLTQKVDVVVGADVSAACDRFAFEKIG
jgi:hypothetical protein